jgi:hypothetical protein
MNQDLEELRRFLERQKSDEPEVLVCEEHGPRTTQVCVGCYAVQQERVERESLPLRMANTAEALRKRVLTHLAASNGASNGHAHFH